MTRKAKAFWIGFLVPVIALWVWGLLGMGFWLVLFLTVPATLVGGLAGMIASWCTGGPPMSRKAKAGLIGFYLPMIPGFVIVIFGSVWEIGVDGEMLAVLYFGGPSILLGLVAAFFAYSCTQDKPDSPQCGKCGYSLIGLTSDRCPECGLPFDPDNPTKPRE